MSYLDIQDLTFKVDSHGEEKILIDSLNLQVEQGDFVVILGGNGAGKSTFFNLLDGTLKASSGHLTLKGEEISKMPLKQQAKKISRVFQDPKQGTAPRMTVLENLLLAKNKGAAKLFHLERPQKEAATFKKLLAQSQNGLEDRLNQATESLSGGQRQALSLFMATVKKPELLLLDEHTAALDPKSGEKIMELTAELVEKEKLTCLMITHNLEDALRFGQRLVILKAGKIVADFSQEKKDTLTKELLFPYFY